jgi:hypothetical protein
METMFALISRIIAHLKMIDRMDNGYYCLELAPMVDDSVAFDAVMISQAQP